MKKRRAIVLVGIMDMGGGMRAVYSAGIYDWLMDNGIKLDYCIGVSAGSANLISYVAGQRGRSMRFYSEYAFRREYMSVYNYIEKRSYIDLDYIYSTLSNTGSEYPFDYGAFQNSQCNFTAVATRASDGKPGYFGKSSVNADKYDVLKASCAVPVACKPCKINDEYYYDGGISDPFPYKKAFSDGCDKLIAVLTRPVEYITPPQKGMHLLRLLLKEYPCVIDCMEKRHELYNNAVAELRRLEKEGKVLIIAPKDCRGVTMLTRDRDAFCSLYNEGYREAEKICKFAY